VPEIGSRKEWTAKDYQAWWKNIESTLSDWLRAGAKEPAPGDILRSLCQIAGDLAVGKIPPAIAKAARRGRSAPGPVERLDIGWGIAYLRACRDGRLEDRAPIKTLAKEYAVHRRTIQIWNKRVPPAPDSNQMSGSVIQREMIKAARLYQEAGRSNVAIAKRARKRRERK
jgi:hypothetical protein